MEELPETRLPGMSSLSEESHLAGKVKKEQPVLVILGNPPYSGHSSNIGEWISSEIKAYFQVDGKPLGEKNPKWLQDDYVKFIRFAQWKIEQAGEGILGFITNHSYLDNPTFRGMRQSLMQSFDEIYILDLHGNSLKKERCPDGSKDENVFDIQQGVAIAVFIKKKGLKKKISHSELWGVREDKYDWLNKHDIKTTKWKKINPASEFYLFIPRDEGLLKLYDTYPKITNIFPVNSVGIVTSRDGFVIDNDKEVLKRRIRMFKDKKLPDEIIRQTFKLHDTSKFKLEDAREAVRKDDDWEQAITKILYRPFDEKWIFYHDAVIERSRKEVMRHMMKENLGLMTNRQVNGKFRHALCTDTIINDCTVSLETRERSYLFPLYLYQKERSPRERFTFGRAIMLFEPQAEYDVKMPNLSSALTEALSKIFKKEPAPEQIFYYIYAVLYSDIYRTKYAEFLKIDFPRIPFAKDYKLFSKMAAYGEKLVKLHLFKSPEPDKPAVRFKGKGDNRVEKLKYEQRRLYINKEQYFEFIEPEIWNYQVGGYQVCEKWLKDRKERILSLDDIKHYLKVVTAIEKTVKIQNEIDRIYPQVEEDVIELKNK